MNDSNERRRIRRVQGSVPEILRVNESRLHWVSERLMRKAGLGQPEEPRGDPAHRRCAKPDAVEYDRGATDVRTTLAEQIRERRAGFGREIHASVFDELKEPDPIWMRLRQTVQHLGSEAHVNGSRLVSRDEAAPAPPRRR